MKCLPLQAKEEAGMTKQSKAKANNFKNVLFHVSLVALGVLLGTVIQHNHGPTPELMAAPQDVMSPLEAPHGNAAAMWARKLPNCRGQSGVACTKDEDNGNPFDTDIDPTSSPPAPPANSNGRPNNPKGPKKNTRPWIDLTHAEPDVDAENEVLTEVTEYTERAEAELLTSGQAEEISITADLASLVWGNEFLEPNATIPAPGLGYELRKLMMSSDDRVGPLACNSDLATAPCGSFAALVAGHNQATNMTDTMLTVPCGECFTVDIEDDSEIDLAGGLLIRGKLHFPSTASIGIRTKFIFVAGVLKMDTPAVGNKVKITMYGDELQSYENQVSTEVCGADSGACTMGSKVIAVIGGELDIQGTEPACPSWEKLAGVGSGSVRPFSPPCHDAADPTTCWNTDTFTVTGNCVHAAGQSDQSNKYTVMCPINANVPHVNAPSSTGIKLTSVSTEPFEYPEADGVTLDLTINGACSRAGHTDSLGKCTVYCPLKSTATIGGGYSGDLTFTSIETPAVPYIMPTGLDLNIASTCVKMAGHTDSWGRCVLRCQVESTANIGSGSSWSQLQLTSRWVGAPAFDYPSDGTTTLSLQKINSCAVSWGHSDARNTCVVYCPLELTAVIRGGYGGPLVFTNIQTGNSYTPSRIMHWAWGGRTMYTYADGYAHDINDRSMSQCQQAADDFNNVFPDVGDTMDVSKPIEEGFDGNTFLIDKVLHWSHNSKNFYFMPSDSAKETCDATAADFQSKFKVGYDIEVSYPSGPSGGQEVAVDGVHHWAWGGSGLYFHPEASDPATCSQVASDFSAKFPVNYKVAVSHRSSAPLGEVVTASRGVHHWSWNGSGFYFYPDDETDSSINSKFPPGTQVQVTYNDDVLEYHKVVVSQGAADCWSPGTEVLLTSHTRSQNDRQIRTIVNSVSSSGELTFDEPIVRPLSLADHPDYAVEIASLNRRIVFDAESDANDETIGGHFIVYHTSTAQHIEGVEIRNFGQQGRLGKYPLHFHKCQDSSDSLVKKNVVRDSNQRGYVVHLTNKVTLEQNVAYDITGHGYFIEDGAETENVFRENIGTGIKVMPADRVAQLSASSGRSETDGDQNGFNGASVFWISNPLNYFYGNIAAGSEKNGYWFDTVGDRMYMSLGAFDDNEVHSSTQFAFTVYHPGWRPTETAVIKNVKVYRNSNSGAFLHATKNIAFDGGLFADNSGKDVFISRGDNIVFMYTHFIGQTPFTSKQANCNGSSGKKVGIHLDPFRFSETVLGDYSGENKGTHVYQCQFSNFTSAATSCGSDSRPLRFVNHQTFVKAYNAPHYIDNVKFDVPSQIDACMSGASGERFDDMSIEIVNDDHGALTGAAGFLVSPKLAPMNSCDSYNDCLEFCVGACLRTVTVVTGNAAFDDDLEMHVRRVSDDIEIVIEKEVRGFPNPAPVHNRFSAAYTVALPKADYQLWFESASTPGVLQWPKYAHAVYEAAPSCTNYVVEGDLQFTKPSIRSECNELIHNGDFSGPPSWESEGWHAAHHGLEISETGGVDGTAAVATTTALSNSNHPSQPLDTTCVEDGDEFEIKFSFMSSTTTSTLPSARIQVADFSTTNKRLETTRWEKFNPAENYQAGEWHTVTDSWTVDSVSANADYLEFAVIGGDQMIILDNVSITKVSGRRNLRASD